MYELAADLGKDIVVALELSGASPSDENLGWLETVLTSIPAGAADTPKYALLHRALKWSTIAAPKGHPRLHMLAAKSYWTARKYGKCQAHFVYCQDGPGLAAMVREWREFGYPHERDLFSLRTLFILLSLNEVLTARSFWNSMINQQLQTQEPTIQCGAVLLAAAEAKNLQFFRMARGGYAQIVRRDATYDKYLDEIEACVFGAKVKRVGLGAVLEALLGGDTDIVVPGQGMSGSSSIT